MRSSCRAATHARSRSARGSLRSWRRSRCGSRSTDRRRARAAARTASAHWIDAKRYPRADRAPQEVAVCQLDRTRIRGRAGCVDHRTDGIEIVADVPRAECLTARPPRHAALRCASGSLHEHARTRRDALALGRRQAQIDRDRHRPQQKARVQRLGKGDAWLQARSRPARPGARRVRPTPARPRARRAPARRRTAVHPAPAAR